MGLVGKLFCTFVILSAMGMTTIKSWGKFDKAPLRNSIFTLLLVAPLLGMIVTALITIWR